METLQRPLQVPDCFRESAGEQDLRLGQERDTPDEN